MFLRKHILKKAGREYCYLKIVENYWKGGRTHQRTLVNLGNVSNWSDEKLQKVVSMLSKQLGTDVVSFSDVRFSSARMLGPFLPLAKLWDRLGMDMILLDAFSTRKMDARAVENAKTMVLSRLVDPRSKKAVWDAVSRDWEIPGVQGDELPLESYYRTLEYLSSAKTNIEKRIHERLVNLFNQDVSLVFYDLTSSYFEGRHCKMARLGYSREHRPDLLQVEIGIMVDAEGMPIGHEVFSGNIKDVSTVTDTLKKLRNEFDVKRCVFIGDDGLASEDNLLEVERLGYEYITSLALGKSRIGSELMRNRRRLDKWSRLDENLWIDPLMTDGHIRYIGSYNPEHAASQRMHRNKRLRSCIDHLNKLVVGPKPRGRKKTPEEVFASADRFLRKKECRDFLRLEHTDEGKLSWKLDRDALRKAYRMDGILVLKTNSTSLSDEEVVRGYRTLWRVEDAFRHIKDGIGLRPIRHWNDSHVLGHIFVCVLAYTLERLYERELERAGLPIAARVALDELRSITVATLEAGDRTLRRRSEITPYQYQLLGAVGIEEVPEFW